MSGTKISDNVAGRSFTRYDRVDSSTSRLLCVCGVCVWCVCVVCVCGCVVCVCGVCVCGVVCVWCVYGWCVWGVCVYGVLCVVCVWGVCVGCVWGVNIMCILCRKIYIHVPTCKRSDNYNKAMSILLLILTGTHDS